MKLRSAWMLLVAAFPLVSLQTSCGDSERSAQETSATGTLRLRLTGESAAGHTYRLRNAELEITGTSTATLHSEDDPDAESLRRDLPAGGYEILLEDGWFLEKQAEDGAFVPVEAVLMSENPAPFEIVAEETTKVQFRFKAGDEIVDLGDGTLEVSIAVEEEEDECAPGEWQEIARLPTTPVSPMVVQGIQRIDTDPDTLLVATMNYWPSSGTPAAIWRIDLDHDTGQATGVSFQQLLDQIQSTRGAFFESSDGTLLTGSGYSSTPPYYSTDHGDSFQQATNGDPPDSTFVYAEFQGQVYAGTSYPGSLYRYNGGGSWNHVFSVPPPHDVIQAMAVHQGRLFVGAAVQDDPSECVEEGSPVYVSSDGVSFTPTYWPRCAGSVKALASAGDQLLALGDAGDGFQSEAFEWVSATERFSHLEVLPFEVWSISQNRFVGNRGAFYAAAFRQGAWDGGIYRSEDGVSWAPILELEGQTEDTFDMLSLEGDTQYTASEGVNIYALDLCQ